MLTIFTIPKPFVKDHVKLIQRNAIKSWLALEPKCQVILFGDDEGVKETAEEFGILHVPEVKKNEFGTPLLNSALDLARKMAEHKILVYLNADIILTSDILKAADKINHPLFLLSGQRCDVNIEENVNFDETDWEKKIRQKVFREGKLHGPLGMDYCFFPGNLLDVLEMPDFAVGRAGWDNWLIYRVRSLGLPMIDATSSVVIVHQNHDYSHSRWGGRKRVGGPEVKKTLDLAGGFSNMLTLRDADWVLTPKGLKRPPYPQRITSKLSLFYPWRKMLGFKRKVQHNL